MSKISPFLSYHGKENVATNNALLLLKFIHEAGNKKLERVLAALLETDLDLNIGLRFDQQVKTTSNKMGVDKGSIPDGWVHQSPFNLLLETKIGTSNNINQLERHANFLKSKTGDKYLFWLLSNIPDEKIKKSAEAAIKHVDEKIQFGIISFEDLINCAYDICPEHDEILKDRIDEFFSFCVKANLTTKHAKTTMKMVLSGRTQKFNDKYHIYFDPCRNFSPHEFLGLYFKKSVRYIGRVDKIVRCNLGIEELIDITDTKGNKISINNEEKDRILGVTRDVREHLGYLMGERYQFWLCSEWSSIDFKKHTLRAPWGTRFFELKDYLSSSFDFAQHTSQIAEQLNTKTWA